MKMLDCEFELKQSFNWDLRGVFQLYMVFISIESFQALFHHIDNKTDVLHTLLSCNARSLIQTRRIFLYGCMSVCVCVWKINPRTKAASWLYIGKRDFNKVCGTMVEIWQICNPEVCLEFHFHHQNHVWKEISTNEMKFQVFTEALKFSVRFISIVSSRF